jgi:hypothetical protein
VTIALSLISPQAFAQSAADIKTQQPGDASQSAYGRNNLRTILLSALSLTMQNGIQGKLSAAVET